MKVSFGALVCLSGLVFAQLSFAQDGVTRLPNGGVAVEFKARGGFFDGTQLSAGPKIACTNFSPIGAGGAEIRSRGATNPKAIEFVSQSNPGTGDSLAVSVANQWEMFADISGRLVVSPATILSSGEPIPSKILGVAFALMTGQQSPYGTLYAPLTGQVALITSKDKEGGCHGIMVVIYNAPTGPAVDNDAGVVKQASAEPVPSPAPASPDAGQQPVK